MVIMEQKTKMKKLTKRQRTRVRRVLNQFAVPINHMSRDGLDEIFEEEYLKMKDLRTQIRDKAESMGYDPEEDLTDVNKESHYYEE